MCRLVQVCGWVCMYVFSLASYIDPKQEWEKTWKKVGLIRLVWPFDSWGTVIPEQGKCCLAPSEVNRMLCTCIEGFPVQQILTYPGLNYPKSLDCPQCLCDDHYLKGGDTTKCDDLYHILNVHIIWMKGSFPFDLYKWWSDYGPVMVHPSSVYSGLSE